MLSPPALYSSLAVRKMELQRHGVPNNCWRATHDDHRQGGFECDPPRCFMSIPRSSDLNHGLRDVSYVSIARAIDRCAWAMEDLLGKGADFTAVATYLNPVDLRHVILTLGVIKSGYRACLECSIRAGRRTPLLTTSDVLQLSSQPPRGPGCALGGA